MVRVLEIEDNASRIKLLQLQVENLKKENNNLRKELSKNLKLLFSSNGISKINDEYKRIIESIKKNKEKIDELDYEQERFDYKTFSFVSNVNLNSSLSVNQLGNALEKIISRVTKEEYVFKKTYVYSIDVDDGEQRFEEKHKDILRKKRFILIKKEYENCGPLLDFVDEETVFDIYHEGKSHYWDNSECINNMYSKLKHDSTIILVPSHKVTVGHYNSEAIISAYLNEEFYPNFYIDPNNNSLNFDCVDDCYRKRNKYLEVIDNFVTILALVKMNEEKETLTDDEINVLADKYILWLENNNNKDLVWDDRIFNTKKQNKCLTKNSEK